MSTKPQVMVVGLDGATFDLIKPWAAEGKLPTFERILKAGAHGDLHVQLPYGTAPNWSSFRTGMNPGKHGFYSFLERVDKGYKIRPIHPGSRNRYGLWDTLGAQGYRVGLVNIPTTYPPTPVNGFMVTGMFTPNERATYTYPPEFKEEIKRVLPDYRVEFQDFYPGGLQHMIADQIKGLHNRLKLTRYLLEEKQLDFIMFVIRGTDRLEHECFRFLDPTHPRYDPDEVAEYGNPVLDYYIELDNQLGQLLADIPEDTIVLFMSDHGQQSLHKMLNVGHFLLGRGYLRVRGSLRSQLKYWLLKHGWSPRTVLQVADAMRVRRTLKKARKSAGNRAFSLQHALFFSIEDVDWAETKAYLATDSGGSISINLKGREPMGQVEPGAEYERVRRELIGDLERLQDPETGQRIIQKAYAREELYHGSYFDKAPDVVIVPTPGYHFVGGHNFPFAELLSPSFGISGCHSQRGIFICYGRGIRKVSLENAGIIDLAPTILHIMGVPVPQDMDGRVLAEIFEKDSEFRRREVKRATEGDNEKGNAAGDSSHYSPEDEKAIEARLRALGYVD